jgi:amino acid adenylation domain-containing protein
MNSYFPLSQQQNRIWSLQKEGISLAVQASIIWKGSLDLDKLKNCLTTIVKNKVALRTGYQLKDDDGSPVQVLHDESKMGFDFYDISHLNETDRLSYINENKNKLKAPNEDSCNCMASISIFKVEECVFELIFTLPALSADSFSLKQLVAELYDLYQDRESGKEVISYLQFSEWQNQLIADPDEDATYFWQQYVLENHKPSSFPFQGIGILSQKSSLQTESIFVGHDLRKGISKELEKTNVTISAFMMTCLAILVNTYKASNRVIIAHVAKNRKYKELFPTIGAIAKTLPAIGEIDADNSIKGVLTEWQKTIENIEAWSEYYNYTMLQNAEKEDALSLFSIGFEYIDLSHALSSSQEIQCEWKSIESTTDYFPIKLTCTDFEGQMQVAFTYNTRYFNSVAVQVVLEHYRTLLKEIVNTGIDTAVREVSIQSNEEKMRIAQQFSPGPHITFPNNLIEEFQKQVNKEPAAPALVCEGRNISYSQLDQLSNQIANYLHDHYGLERQDFMVLLVDRSEWAIAFMLASLKLGAVYVPLDISSPPKQINYILSDTGARVVVLQNEALSKALALDTSKIVLLEESIDSIMAQKTDRIAIAKEEEELAYIIYTSGTSGKPKGVQITEHNLMNYVSWANTCYFDHKKGNTFGLFTSLAFDLTITCIFTTLLRGDQLNIYPGADVNHNLLEALAENSTVNVLKITPSHVSLLQHLDLESCTLDTVILGGEALTHEHVNILKDLNPAIRIFNEYGPTETTVGSTVKEIVERQENINIGHPIANTEIYILDESNRPQPIGVPGEICIAGEGVSKGYLGKIKLTEEKFVQNPFAGNGNRIYRTGDLGRWLPDGAIEYLGRNDNQLKINGHRIELKAIENTLLSFEAIKDVVVMVKKDAADDQSIVAFVKADKTIESNVLKTFLADELPTYMIPTFFKQLDHFPLTINGKVDLKQLSSIDLTEFQEKPLEKPKNEIEKEILDIWTEVLDVENISVRDKFFDLGGHSIKAVKIVAKISQKFDKLLGLDALLDNATIQDLARLVSGSETAVYQSIETLEKQEYYDVSFAQSRLWVLDQLETNKIIYNMPQALLMRGKLDVEAFNKTIQTIVKRHESLRTNFVGINDVPKQKIKPVSSLNFKVGYKDLSKDPKAMETARSLAEKEASTSFDLEKGNLFRVQLLQLSHEEHVALFTMHHIISDAWSIGVLTNEIALIYNAYRAGKEPVLTDLKHQYKDYAAWQKEQLEGESLQPYRQYWLDKLNSFPPKINLKTDFPRPEVKLLTGRKVTHFFDESLTQPLNDISQVNQVSLFTVLLSAMYTLFYKLTQHEDIVIGTSVAGREHADLENQVGFFVNLLALRTKFKGDDAFTTLLEKVKETTIGAFSHQLYPFDKLVEDFDIEREMNQSPLFDVLVVFQNTDVTNIEITLDGLKVEDMGGDLEKCEFDIIFNFIPTKKGILLNTHYSNELYEEETILIMMKKLELICKAIAAQPEIKLQDINIELEEEKKIKENKVSLDFNF